MRPRDGSAGANRSFLSHPSIAASPAMSTSFRIAAFLAAAFLVITAALPVRSAEPGAISGLAVDPPQLALRGSGARWLMLVNGTRADGSVADLTRTAEFVSTAPEIAAVSPGGTVRGVKDGQAVIRITAGGKS